MSEIETARSIGCRKGLAAAELKKTVLALAAGSVGGCW